MLFLIQYKPHQETRLINAVLCAKAAGIAAVFRESAASVEPDGAFVFRDDLQLKLGKTGSFRAFDGGFGQRLSDAFSPMGSFDADAEFGAMADL